MKIQWQKFNFLPLCMTIFFATSNSVEASKLHGHFKLTVPDDPNVVNALRGVNDLEVKSGISTLTRLADADCRFPLNYIPAGGMPSIIDPNPDVDINFPRDVTFGWEFAPINPNPGDMFIYYCKNINSGGRLTTSFTKDGNKIKINGRDIFAPGRFFSSRNHRVLPTKSFDFFLTLNNDSFDPEFDGTSQPIIFSNLRIFTDVDFGQTSLEDGSLAIESFLEFNQGGELFDTSGNLLRVPPGLEIDVNTLLSGFSGWNSTTEELTLNEPEINLPPITLQDELGIVMIFGEALFDDPEQGPIVSNFGIAHQVSKIVPEPTSTLSLLSLGILGAGATLKRRVKRTHSIEKEPTNVG